MECDIVTCRHGEHWRRLRSAINKQIVFSNLLQFLPQINKVSTDFIHLIERKKEDGQVNDIFPLLLSWSFEGMASAALQNCQHIQAQVSYACVRYVEVTCHSIHCVAILCVCLSICVCFAFFVCVHVLCLYVCMYVCVFMCVRVCANINMCQYMYMCVSVLTYMQ